VITPYKGREVRPGDLVKIRWNLRTGGWSIMAANGTMRDRVVAHAEPRVYPDKLTELVPQVIEHIDGVLPERLWGTASRVRS
jgi:hypothetical protein